MSLEYQMLINGNLCEGSSGRKSDVINPADGQIITQVPLADKEDVELALLGSKTHKFYGRTGGVVPSPEEIAEQVRKLIKPKSAGQKSRGKKRK